ncbi:MAG: DEAD/DEAH box helicase, partial [Alphaproteobacteria bacterium]|nr:DEAD/DEAH box helicase [Alphaproteobacteria bacterium]
MSFSDLGLSIHLTDHLRTIGFIKPTPVQVMVIPQFIQNSDIIASAQTGTGKTGAFLLPIIDFLTDARKRNKLPRVLILEPTRELATQVFQEFERLKNNPALKAVVLVGGESNILQERALAQGVDVIIATPGRLLDLQERQKIIMHDIRCLVIDEADRMLDMGFIPAIDTLMKILPFNKQTLLFSATFTPEIEKLGQRYLINPHRMSAEAVNQVASTIDQYVYKVKSVHKQKLLEDILAKEPNHRGIIFCNKKSDINDILNFIQKQKIPALAIHGDLTQGQRNTTLADFKDEKARILVASDVAARGLNIQDLEFVINYEAPINADSYVHRIGRTGRAGKTGKAYTFVSEKEEKSLRNIELLIGEKITVLTYAPTESTQKKVSQKNKDDNHTQKGIEKKVT